MIAFTILHFLKVIVTIANTSNFICEHRVTCHVHCYERQRRSCAKLLTALNRIYDTHDANDDVTLPAGATAVTSENGSGPSRRETITRERINRRVRKASMFRAKILAFTGGAYSGDYCRLHVHISMFIKDLILPVFFCF